MSKKSRKGLLLLAGVLSFSALGLTGCGETPEPNSPDTEDHGDEGGKDPEVEKVTSITVANKAALTAPWKVGEADRTIELTIAPSTITQDDARIKITSSKPDCVKVTGRTLKAVAPGNVEIKITADDVSTKFNIRVTPADVEVTAIAITNEADLKADWHVGEKTRTISLKTTPETNIDNLVAQQLISVESATPTVIEAAGLVLTAKGVGTSKITVKYTKGEKVLTAETTLEVKELPFRAINDVLTEVAGIIPNGGKDSNTPSAYKIKAVAVASNLGDKVLLADAAGDFVIAKGEVAKNVTVGKTYLFQGKFNNYFGNLEYKNPEFTEITEEAEKVALPSTDTALTIDSFVAYHELAGKANDGIADASEIVKPIYGTFSAKVIENTSVKDSDYRIVPVGYDAEGTKWISGTTIKVNKEITDKLEPEFSVGQTITITGGLSQFNSGEDYLYYDLIPSAIEITDFGNVIKTVTANIPADKRTVTAYSTADYNGMVTTGPEGAVGEITWEFASETPDMLITAGSRVMATKEGTYTATAYSNKGKKSEVKSEPVTITVAGTEDNLYSSLADAPVTPYKTLKDLQAGKGESVKDKLYVIEGTVTAGDTTSGGAKYGHLTITDGKDTIKSDGFSTSLLDFVLTADGTQIDYFKNPKNFLDHFGRGKTIDVGDKVRLVATYDKRVGSYTSYDINMALLKVTQKVTEIPMTLTLPQGVTAEPAKETYTVYDEVKLTYAGDKVVKFNGAEVEKGTDGKYTITIVPGDNVVKLASVITGTTVDFKWAANSGTLTDNVHKDDKNHDVAETLTIEHEDLRIVNKKADSGYFVNNYPTDMKFYANQTLTISSISGKKILSIHIVFKKFDDSKFSNLAITGTDSKAVRDDKTLILEPAGGATSITFTNNNTGQLNPQEFIVIFEK